MTPLRIGPYKVRVWRQEAEEGPIDNADLLRMNTPNSYTLVTELKVTGDPIFYLAEQILRMDRVNAVEVVNEDGVGQVLYADWP